MEGIRVEKFASLTDEEQLDQANEMANWFVPFLYGVDIEAGDVSLLVKARMAEIVGNHHTDRQLELLKALVNELPAEHKNNAVLYCVGYPQDALSVLGDGDVNFTTELLIQAGEQYRPVVTTQARQKVYPTDAQPEARRANKDVELRAELNEAGLTAEQVRNRLNAYVASTNSKSRTIVLRSAARFTKWFEGPSDIETVANGEKISVNGLLINIKRLSEIALNAAYDSIQHDMGDPISEALLLPPPEPKRREPKVKKPEFAPRSYESYEEGMDDHSELAWQDDALCAQTDPEAFFPEKGGSTRDAKKICAGCEVRNTCLEYALGNDERFGIWGGLSERERRKLRKSA